MISCLYGCCSKGLQAFRPSVSIQQCHEETNLKFMSFKCDQNFTSEAKKTGSWNPVEGGGGREEGGVEASWCRNVFVCGEFWAQFPDAFQCFDTDPSYTTPDSPAAVGGGEALLLPQCLFCSWNNPVQNQWTTPWLSQGRGWITWHMNTLHNSWTSKTRFEFR